MKSEVNFWTNNFYLSHICARILSGGGRVMAKIRELSSIESGLSEAIKNLKTKIIQDATGKSESYIRKCSDPDLDQQIDHVDAIKIDKACIQNGLTPYMLRAHQYIIEKEIKNIKTQNRDINELLIKFTILHGQLMDAIKTAKNPRSDKGETITSAEKKEVFEAFSKLEDKMLTIKNAIEKK